jgi:hypothetical protein
MITINFERRMRMNNLKTKMATYREVLSKVKLTKLVSRKIAMAIGCLLVLSASLAITYAAGPEDVQGTWSWTANNSSGRLHIFQRADGSIFGTMHHGAVATPGDVTDIEGYYLPDGRRIVFVRKGSNGVPFQFYQGYLSRSGLRMAGTFHVWNPSGGGLIGEADFNFQATWLSDTP